MQKKVILLLLSLLIALALVAASVYAAQPVGPPSQIGGMLPTPQAGDMLPPSPGFGLGWKPGPWEPPLTSPGYFNWPYNNYFLGYTNWPYNNCFP